MGLRGILENRIVQGGKKSNSKKKREKEKKNGNYPTDQMNCNFQSKSVRGWGKKTEGGGGKVLKRHKVESPKKIRGRETQHDSDPWEKRGL